MWLVTFGAVFVILAILVSLFFLALFGFVAKLVITSQPGRLAAFGA